MGDIAKITASLVCTCIVHWAAIGSGVPDKRDLKVKERRKETSEYLVSVAEKYIGLKELTNNNDHPQITKWMKECGLRGDKGYPWCAAAQTGIHNEAVIPNPESARVVEWFQHNITWKKGWPDNLLDKKGMVGAIYYPELGRYGHIVLIVGEDNNSYYTLEGNTNGMGARDGDGFYRKIRSKKSIAILADYCVSGKDFITLYDKYLQKAMK